MHFDNDRMADDGCPHHDVDTDVTFESYRLIKQDAVHEHHVTNADVMDDLTFFNVRED